ncbi:trypsin-like peptidase domain-containing protein, partial [Candidatus Saccharibacteria bacterium]|nr:trypsin-like peptidase domain-containing protein [Candidatus Saccharibacteria bacterium]
MDTSEDIFNKSSKPATTKTATKSAHNPALALSIIALICGAGGLGFSAYTYFYGGSSHIVTLAPGQDGNSANFTEGSIAEVVSRVSPSVVSIVTEVRTNSWYGTSTSSAAGTGFILTDDGYIMTNKHVIDGAKNITVVLEDGTTYTNTKLIGTDPLNDAAILKIDATNLTPVTLGDSKTISTGQSVIAIGNALGVYGNSVTSGVISGTGRSIIAADSTGEAYESLTDLIQTDAAINSGNSGGPLVNATGQVIGINTATSESGENIGFTIPISSVKGIINTAIKNG